MLKKVPIMPGFFSTSCPFLTITNTYSTELAAILRFRVKNTCTEDQSNALSELKELEDKGQLRGIETLSYI